MNGSVSFEALGQAQSLRLTTGAGRRLEKALGVSFNTILQQLDERVGFDFATLFFAACLDDGNGTSEEMAEAIIDDIGGLQGATIKIGETVQASVPQEKPSKKGAKRGNAGKGKG